MSEEHRTQHLHARGGRGGSSQCALADVVARESRGPESQSLDETLLLQMAQQLTLARALLEEQDRRFLVMRRLALALGTCLLGALALVAWAALAREVLA